MNAYIILRSDNFSDFRVVHGNVYIQRVNASWFRYDHLGCTRVRMHVLTSCHTSKPFLTKPDLFSSVLLGISILNKILFPVINTSRVGTSVPSFLLLQKDVGPVIVTSNAFLKKKQGIYLLPAIALSSSALRTCDSPP
jgi:hypothetical protein